MLDTNHIIITSPEVAAYLAARCVEAERELVTVSVALARYTGKITPEQADRASVSLKEHWTEIEK